MQPRHTKIHPRVYKRGNQIKPVQGAREDLGVGERREEMVLRSGRSRESEESFAQGCVWKTRLSGGYALLAGLFLSYRLSAALCPSPLAVGVPREMGASEDLVTCSPFSLLTLKHA